jgi:hypothetical protein
MSAASRTACRSLPHFEPRRAGAGPRAPRWHGSVQVNPLQPFCSWGRHNASLDIETRPVTGTILRKLRRIPCQDAPDMGTDSRNGGESPIPISIGGHKLAEDAEFKSSGQTSAVCHYGWTSRVTSGRPACSTAGERSPGRSDRRRSQSKAALPPVSAMRRSSIRATARAKPLAESPMHEFVWASQGTSCPSGDGLFPRVLAPAPRPQLVPRPVAPEARRAEGGEGKGLCEAEP